MPDHTRLTGPTQAPTGAGVAASSASQANCASNGRGNAFLQDMLRERTASGGAATSPSLATPAAGACTSAGPATPAGDYVTMAPGGKAAYLAELFRMPNVADTLKKRGFNAHDQTQLAAIMQNEGGTNERRRMLASHYSSAAGGLVRKLNAGGFKDLTQLAGAESSPRVVLTEDERALLSAAQQGKVDLVALNGPPGPARDAATERLTEVGIDHQVALHDEHTALSTRQRGGENLPKADSARLGSLDKRSLYSSGNLSDARGLSSERFRGVYDEGQTRFEAERFARSRNTVERWGAGGGAGNGGAVGVGGESAKGWVGRHPEAAAGNHDALADAETSWGTAQIMGHYADRGDLKNADGQQYNMNDMRAAAGRRSPTGTDVDMQISYFRDVARVPGRLGNAEELSAVYNGAGAPPAYAQGLRDNASRYERARQGLPAQISAVNPATNA